VLRRLLATSDRWAAADPAELCAALGWPVTGREDDALFVDIGLGVTDRESSCVTRLRGGIDILLTLSEPGADQSLTHDTFVLAVGLATAEQGEPVRREPGRVTWRRSGHEVVLLPTPRYGVRLIVSRPFEPAAGEGEEVDDGDASGGRGTWEAMDVPAIRSWIRRLVALPLTWRRSDLGWLSDRTGWALAMPSDRLATLSTGLPPPVHRVFARLAGDRVTGLHSGVARWDGPGDAPDWLHQDAFDRARAAATAELGPPDGTSADSASRLAWWRRDGWGLHVESKPTGHGISVLPPAESDALVAAAAARGRPPVSRTWEALAAGLAAALRRLPEDTLCVVADRDDPYRYVQFAQRGGSLQASTVSSDLLPPGRRLGAEAEARLAADGWAPDGDVGLWSQELDVPAPHARYEALAAACVAALRQLGASGPASLAYRAWHARTNEPVALPQLGLGREGDAGAAAPPRPPATALPEAAAPALDGRTEEYTAGFRRRGRDHEPAELLVVLYGALAGGGRPNEGVIAFDGAAWGRDRRTGWTVPDLEVTVDRLTAERLALHLTGVPLPDAAALRRLAASRS
jgi:hypothetical protein